MIEVNLNNRKNFKTVLATVLTLGNLLVFFVLSSFSATIISTTPELELLIEEALNNNHEIKSIVETIESFNDKGAFQGSLADPKLGFALQNLPAESLSLDQEAMTQKQVFVSQKFPWPGKRKLKTMQSSLEAERQMFLLKEKKLKTARNIAEAYYNLGLVSESIKLNYELTQLIENLLNVASAKYSSGRGLQQDIFKAQVELSKFTDEKIQLRKQYRVIENKINALLNRDNYKKITPPSGSDIDLYSFEMKTEYFKTLANKNNPTLGALNSEIEKKNAMTLLAKKSQYPDFDIKLAYGQRDDDQSGRGRDDFISFSTALNIPLWKHSRQDKDIMSKKASERASINRYKNFEKILPHRVEATIVEIKEMIQSYKLYKKRLIPQSIQWAQSAVSDYEVGKTDFGMMINARIQPLKFELKAKKYLFEILKKRAELEELTGGL